MITTDISVIIVSYNCCDVLQLALDSVHNAIEGLNADVYVVDNNSTDETVDILTERYKWVNLLVNNVNVGFGRANNMAMVRCKGRIVLLLNPDTVIPRNFLRSLIAYFDENQNSGAVGVQMTNSSGVFLKESKRGYTSISNSLFKLTGLWRLAPHSERLNGYYLGHEDRNSECVAPVLSGACMAFPHTLMKTTGLFDEAYFMYSEDIDLSWRMHIASAQGNRYLGYLNMVHFKGQSTPQTIRYVYYFYASMVTFVKKNEFKHHNSIFNYFIILGIMVAFLLAVVRLYVRKFIKIFVRKRLIVKELRVSDVADIPHDAQSHYNVILFDVDSDIEKVIKYMQSHKKQFHFGFYNKENVSYIGRE